MMLQQPLPERALCAAEHGGRNIRLAVVFKEPVSHLKCLDVQRLGVVLVCSGNFFKSFFFPLLN